MVADPDPGKSEGGDSREVRRVGGGGGVGGGHGGKIRIDSFTA